MTTDPSGNVNTITRPLSHQSEHSSSAPGTPARGLSTRRVTSWKQHNSLISAVAEDKAWEHQQHQQPQHMIPSERTAVTVPGQINPLGLHAITTTGIPRSPTRAYYGHGGGTTTGTPATPATSNAYYLYSPSPMSADSVRSTAALLPSTIQPYVPSEHHQTPQLHSASTFGPQQSPWSATTASPLLKNYGWPLPVPQPHEQQQEQQQQQQQQRQQRFNGGNITLTTHGIPPSPRSPRFAGGGLGGGNGSGNGRKPAGSPVESVAIRTTFDAPPKSPRK